MIAFLAAVTPTGGVVGAALAYVGVGAGVAVALRRKRIDGATAWSALAVWPMLVPLLGAGEGPRPTGPGPLAERIRATFASLERALAHPAASDVGWRADVDGLRAALDTADERLGMVDHLLRESPSDAALASSVDTLRRARDHAASEIEEVLSGVERLRLQIGLLALAGDATGIGEHLKQLRARVSALDEMAKLR